ncbi:glutamine-hydrolyzing carbamoyl-phosphate synthase small subunit [candidate division KSB1 bacterium]
MTKLKLILTDGTEFVGESFGFLPNFAKASMGKPKKEVDGEVVFNTGMVGYPETFTDPSYRGQILVCTYPMIGNYGIPGECKLDTHLSKRFESLKVHLRGIVINEYSAEHSHWKAKKSLSDFLKKHKIPAIEGVDTRVLTQKLREHGVMLGKIAPESSKFSKAMAFSDPNASNLVAEASVKKKEIITPKGKAKCTVALLDCGIKHNIIRSFLDRGCKVIRLPWDYDIEELKGKYDGLFISNGPGDPKMAIKATEAIKHVMKENKPIFGICLGTQLMALSVNADTYKLKYGHRSANQPCIDLETGRCYITSQNHGYAVDKKTMPKGWKVWFENANDGTLEGIKHAKKPWFAVQFHPEASPGPEDAAYLFDEFIDKLKNS